jgi:GNAT superfamily N-acetyltransferase
MAEAVPVVSDLAPFSAETYEIAPVDAGRPPVRLGPLAASEVPALAQALASLEPWVRYAYPASAMVTYLAATEPGAPRFAVRCGEELAGVAGLRLSWLRGPYIQLLALLAPFQRRGIGGAFLDWAEAETRKAGQRNLWIAASEINADAIRLYERRGFAAVAQLDDLVCEGFAEILMRKRLL